MTQSSDKWEGRWERVKGKAREHFGRLTDDDVAQARGKRENLLGKIQEKYGETKEKAEEMLKDFERRHF